MQSLIISLSKRKNFIFFSLLKVLVMVLALITNIFIVRELSLNDYGVFSVALMSIGLITTFGFSWSSSSILYFGSKEKSNTGKLNKTFWARNIIIFVSLIITSFLFLFFHKQINAYIGEDFSFIILIWLYVSVAEDYLSQYYLAVKKQLLSTMLSLTAKVIYILLIMLFTFDVRTLIILNIVSHASVLFYILGMNKNDVGKFEFDKEWFKEILNFSLWQLFGYSGLYLINFGDIAVIKYFMTTEDVAIYNAAYKLFNSIANFAFVVTSYYAASITQSFAKGDSHKLRSFFYKERFVIFAVSTIAHIVVMLFSNQIITTLYGEKYSSSVPIFIILMIGSIARYLAVFYTLYYNANGKHKVLQYLNIFRAILNLVLDVVFINIFGLLGPAIATTTALILTFLFSVYYCEKRIYKQCQHERFIH
ncbi:lipopolysaccharide biosynthesis protein [Alkalibacterium sp. 20]|uniref:lipopolysaccharide biosynthesis protein n=1 Tax=Alkalibacterium sp. 20 TaxID=1798803 RepID=UPI0009001C40|nr:oligosaccharide flippase family protein [Alkalibacterium sp. 20]OJF94707.1 hypothetical protein AX762_07465 [Alkalibacterium sp. 20]